MNHELEQRVRRADRGAGGLRRPRRARARSVCAWPSMPLRWAGGTTTSSPTRSRGRRASFASWGFAPESFGATLEGRLTHVHPEDREQFHHRSSAMASAEDPQPQLRAPLHSSGRLGPLVPGRRAGHSVTRAGTDPLRRGRSRHHPAKGGGRAPDHARAGTRSSRPQPAGGGAIGAASQPGQHDAGVHRGGRRPYPALSRTHTMLSETRWRGVELGRIVGGEIAPFATGQSRADRGRGTGGVAAAADGSVAGAGAARARHECREARRLVRARRAASRSAGRSSRTPSSCAGPKRAGLPPRSPPGGVSAPR